ncbi:efflux transporter, RND family, MFP subunit [Methylophaga frappieri]|uniref:Efflux transporter, RND family, MFP subunit n=1 Tax=Methylophaga frappieri (strain ATCC BAA-2434 / DSM 25690 / JAM7) TaxID=754477 RepID=I1YJK4_METFJ|nr:efflux RND transporter periplasmic adaptor subunit [Methylophaga frappieri]AFJ03097.1 efflux transporter, RND family, MFP subunit [Methylophaga frappieri]
MDIFKRFRRFSTWFCHFGLLFVLGLSVAYAEDLPVTIVKPVLTDTGERIQLSGSFSAERQAMLSPRMDGLVKSVRVDAGDAVKQGDLLIELDSVLTQLQLTQARATSQEAQAAVTEAKRLVEEAERLRGDNYISATELANRKANLAVTEAALAAAKANASRVDEERRRHQLTAPFDGVISAKMTEAGEWINRGDQVLELVSLEQVRLDINVPQERFTYLNKDSQITIYPDALPNQSLTGKVIAIVPVSNPQARSFLVRAVVDDPQVTLLPGTSATAAITLKSNQQPGLSLPRDAVLRHPDGGRSVFVVNADNTVSRQSVVIQQETPQSVIVSEGLAQDDRVVLRGNEVLKQGNTVSIVEGN